ncbi:MAG: magnesium protoporphyrin IX methyltransferase [Pseudomonadota bacterium]
MESVTYQERRGRLETYFDSTAADAWSKLTSDAPVSKIRATVRAGRDRMRATLLDWLPEDLSGRRLLDAGCGTGALAVEAARRGAEVMAVDLSPTLLDLARERAPTDLAGSVTFRPADMLDTSLGRFDHVVAMDSLIHYRLSDMVGMLQRLCERTEHSVLFTFAPRTAALTAMHAVGKAFPRKDRSPAIEPVSPSALARAVAEEPALTGWSLGRHQRIKSGFYFSQAQELMAS